MQPHGPIISEIMSAPAITIEPGTRVEDVLALAERRAVHHFPIIERGALIGLVCTCDLRDALPHLRAIDLAHQHVVTIAPHLKADDAARLMSEEAVGSVVVVGSEGVVGMVTREDVVQSAPELAGLMAEGHCSACKTRHHLKPGPNGTFLCADCLERAKEDSWFDTPALD
jgi:acetoin utilization protein AcuB